MAGPPLGPSSVTAFQDALLLQLQNRPNLANTNVVIGPPAPGVSQASQWIAFLNVVGLEKWAVLGRLQKEEDYTQTIYISVLTRDGEVDSRHGRDIAYNLRQEIADQLIADPTANATVWQCQLTKNQKFEPRLGVTVPNADGNGVTTDLSWREAALYLDILVKNRM